MATKETQVSKQNNGKFKGMYIVTPRSNEGYKEIFARSGERRINFGVPVELSEKDIAQLNNQKEATKGNQGSTNPYELAKSRGVSIEVAMDMMGKMGDTTAEIQWLPKYNIIEA